MRDAARSLQQAGTRTVTTPPKSNHCRKPGRGGIAALVAAIALAMPGLAQARDLSACRGVDFSLTPHRRAALTPALLSKLKAEDNRIADIEILNSYRYGGWTILYINSHISDEFFLFFHGDPRRTRYVASFQGAVGVDEGPETKSWTLANAPGIPLRLADCFVALVTPR